MILAPPAPPRSSPSQPPPSAKTTPSKPSSHHILMSCTREEPQARPQPRLGPAADLHGDPRGLQEKDQADPELERGSDSFCHRLRGPAAQTPELMPPSAPANSAWHKFPYRPATAPSAPPNAPTPGTPRTRLQALARALSSLGQWTHRRTPKPQTRPLPRLDHPLARRDPAANHARRRPLPKITAAEMCLNRRAKPS